MAETIIASFDNTTLSDSLKIELIEGEEKVSLKNAADDFNRGEIGDQWQEIQNEMVITETGSQLNFQDDVSAGQHSSRYYSKSNVLGSGIFDGSVDFNSLSAAAGEVWCTMGIWANSSNYATITKRDGSNSDWRIWWNIGGSTTTTLIAGVNTSGTLRLRKEADLIMFIGDDGTGEVLLGSVSGFSVANLQFRLLGTALNGSTGGFNFDNYVINEDGWYPTSGPTVMSEIIDLGSIKKVLSSEILIPSNTIASDTDIQVALSLDGGAFSSYYNLDSAASDNLYPIKVGEIGGASVTCQTIQIQIKLNSSGLVYQEAGKPEIYGVTIWCNKFKKLISTSRYRGIY